MTFRKSISAVWTIESHTREAAPAARGPNRYHDRHSANPATAARILRLRALFDQAYELIAPSMTAARPGVAGRSTALAFHAARPACPELSEEEAHIVVIALARAFEERRR